MPVPHQKLQNPTSVDLSGLYAIADTHVLAPSRLLSAAQQALAGGARILQYRDKSADTLRRRDQAQALAALCQQYAALFVVNDDIELAAELQAAVHLGRDDAELSAARARLGAQAIIGVSCYNQLQRALQAQELGADYVAFGSFYPSPSKPTAQHAEVELLRRARARIHLPIVAIGGINADNAAALVAAGADAVAVISDIFASDDITAAARRYATLFPGADSESL